MAVCDSGDQTRPSLLLRLVDPQNIEAWETFVEVYGPLVYGHARRRSLKHEDAEDVTQKVFARVSAAIRTFEYQPDIGRFRDWLGTIVRNEVNRFLRQNYTVIRSKGGAEETGLDQVIAPTADTVWTAEFNTHILQLALQRAEGRFEPATWRAFQRVWLERAPAQKVAEEMNQPIDWVYVAKSRALKQVWEEVQELASDTTIYLHNFSTT
jgi:RNA polymerase sigma-70 factor (ECF subfamily)